MSTFFGSIPLQKPTFVLVNDEAKPHDARRASRSRVRSAAPAQRASKPPVAFAFDKRCQWETEAVPRDCRNFAHRPSGKAIQLGGVAAIRCRVRR